MVRTAPRSRRLSLALAVGLLAGLLPPATAPAVAANVVPSATVSSERLSGGDRYATVVAVSKRLFPSGGAPVVYLASGEDFPDALSAAPIAARRGGVLLFSRRDALPAVVEAELIRLAPAEVVLVGGTAVLSGAVGTRVESVLPPGTTVRRIAGADRFATAALLSADTFAPGEAHVVFVVSGLDFPDALAVASIAATRGSPMLLVTPTTLPPTTAAELDRLNPARVVMAGGTRVISSAVASALRSYAPAVERVAGPDRYATAVALADRFLPDAPGIMVATGRSFPDGLAAAPLSARMNAPVLFVQADAVPPTTRDAVRARRPTTIVALGGAAAVGQITLGGLVGWADGRLGLPPPFPDYPAHDAGYHDYGEMFIYIKSAEIAFPDLVRVTSIGTSYQGRDIWAAKISDNVAVDEDEPEVLVDALHHAREHLTVEQALYLLKALTTGYGSDATVRRLVDERETWIVFAVNPDGWAYDLTGSPYRGWRKNRQPTPGSTSMGTDPNRNYGYRWGCCGGSSGNPSAWNYRGPGAWSAPEVRVMRDFVLSRRVGGIQQIRTHITLHTNGELILWPYGYTFTDVPGDMTPDDHATFVAMGRAMARTNGYTAQQSSDLYKTDGDQIDWMYGNQGIFSFTFELYPTEQVSSRADHEPPDEVIGMQTARNRAALLYLIDLAACPYAAIGKAGTYC